MKESYTINGFVSCCRPSLFVGTYGGQTYAVNSLVREADLKLEVCI